MNENYNNEDIYNNYEINPFYNTKYYPSSSLALPSRQNNNIFDQNLLGKNYNYNNFDYVINPYNYNYKNNNYNITHVYFTINNNNKNRNIIKNKKNKNMKNIKSTKNNINNENTIFFSSQEEKLRIYTVDKRESCEAIKSQQIYI